MKYNYKSHWIRAGCRQYQEEYVKQEAGFFQKEIISSKTINDPRYVDIEHLSQIIDETCNNLSCKG